MLASVTRCPRSDPAPNRLCWPGYAATQAVWWGEGPVAGVDCVVVAWEFSVYGGSFGEVDAAAFAAAAEHAAVTRRPLLSFLRSGGTRLQEGVAGLVGLPRATLAAAGLDEAGVAHVAVVDHPTTGGVWVTIASRADLRCAVAGATVGFAGPRVVAAVTGTAPGADSHTAEAAWRAGLVDAVVEPDAIQAWLAAALTAAAGTPTAAGAIQTLGDSPAPEDENVAADEVRGWAQVLAARAAGRTSGGAALDAVTAHGVELAGGDPAVRARLGLLAGSTPPSSTPPSSGALGIVAVAVAAEPGGAPGPGGYRLLARAARLAGKLRLPLVLFVDTPGADPSAQAEADGVAAAIGSAMEAVLRCPSPTVSVIVGEGGSGGALAAACADAVLMTPDSYLTALSPEGAAATLRIPAERAADLGGLRPIDLLRLGFADEVLPSGAPAAVAGAIATTLARLTTLDQGVRLSTRWRKWSTALPGHL
ncbi:acetyl-CoA carboxylase subunit alpha/beta [Pseudofrankia sp. EUN1h]|nr:acetyl-CoA carboxylase subunit alpha/beta [Pseudofrankia sp. EUN1h]